MECGRVSDLLLRLLRVAGVLSPPPLEVGVGSGAGGGGVEPCGVWEGK